MAAVSPYGELPPIQFETKRYLPAPPAVVFALISDHAALPTWVPGLRRVDVDGSRATHPGGVGTRRTLYPSVGVPGTEVVVAF